VSDLKISLGVLQRISEFLAELPQDQIADLAEGRARLAYVPLGSTEPAPSGTRSSRSRGGAARTPFVPSQATVELLGRIEAFHTREDVAKELAPLKGTALVDIGKALNIPGAGGLRVGPLRAEIVEATVGRRLDSIAIRGFDGPRP